MAIRNEDYYNTLYRVWSVMAFGAGTRLLESVTADRRSAESVYIALKDGAGPEAAVKAASDISLDHAERMLELCDKKRIEIVTKDDPLYPARLSSLYNAPPVLFYKGDISGIDDRLSVGVVGTREPSEYSRRVACGIVSLLSRHGFDIVSGFAQGIDICAHMTAVKNGARTFAVLGCGLDVDYPKPNARYRDYILQKGAFITEYLPGTMAYPANFPNRNRIIAALSMSIAVIEAGAASGSLNTALHGSEQGKTVFAVPPADLYDRRYRGNTELIRNGAIPLMGISDILSEYSTQLSHTIVETDKLRERINELKAELSAEKRAKKEALGKAKKDSKKETKQAADDNKLPAADSAEEKRSIPEGLSPDGASIAAVLLESAEPLRADDIAAKCDMDIADVLTELTEMEILGAVRTENGAYLLD